MACEAAFIPPFAESPAGSSLPPPPPPVGGAACVGSALTSMCGTFAATPPSTSGFTGARSTNAWS